MGALVLGHTAHHPLPWRGSPLEASHGQMHAGVIDECQAPHVERVDDLPVVSPCLLAPRRVVCSRGERLLLRGVPGA